MNFGISFLGAGATLLLSLILLDKEPAPEKLEGDPSKILEDETPTTSKKKVRGKRKKK